MAKYGHHLRKVPMPATQLTGGLLRQRLRTMSPSSMGLDGWSLQDVRSLLDRALDWLAQLLQLVEDEGQWPGVLAEGGHVPHPETRGGGPPGHPPADGPVHGLPAVGGGPGCGMSCSGRRRGPTPRPTASDTAGKPSTGRRSRPSSWSWHGSRGGIWPA